MTKKKKIISLAVFITGLVAMAASIVFLVINILNSHRAADAEYLVSAENWVLEGEDSVVWDFTEIGKGTLTTNNHENDYDFIWAIEDGRLKIRTDWLYELDNEYEYRLDQNTNTLELKDGDATYTFKASFEK